MSKRKAVKRKSVEWMDLTFTWYPHRKSYRVTRERVNEDEGSVRADFVGWFKGSFEEAKLGVTESAVSDLMHAVENALTIINNMRVGLSEQMHELARASRRVQRMRHELTRKPGAKERRLARKKAAKTKAA